MVNYYVVFHKDSSNIYGFSTFPPISLPDDYICEERMSESYPTNLTTWDSTSKQFIFADPVTLTRREFLEKFTTAERVSIREVAKTNPIIFDFMEMLNVSQFVDVNNPSVMQGLLYLVSIGVLESNRPNEILGV